MASAEYEETYVGDNVVRNTEQRSYEEINTYENEERTIGGPPSTSAMPPPQLIRNPPQQDAVRSHEMKKYGLKCLIVAFVIVSVIFAGMFAAVFAMITTGREQGGNHKLSNPNEIEDLRQAFQNRMTKLENTLNEGQIGPWYKATNGLLYKLWYKEKNYTDAESDCQRIGARLVSTGIRSKAVRSEIWTNVMMSKAKTVWIGLSQPYIALGNDSWIWIDGAAYNKSNTPWSSANTPWSSGQPDNSNGREDCANIWAGDPNGINLNDGPCDKDFAYICEKEL